MSHTTKNYLLQQQEEHELRKISNLFFRNYKFFIISLVLSIGFAYLAIRFSVPIYEVSCSILIKEDSKQSSGNMTDYLNSNIFGKNLNFQNELLILKSAPVIEQTIRNLNLTVSYSQKREFQWFEAYQEAPFRVLFSPNHVQPIGIRFVIKFEGNGGFIIRAESDKAAFYDYSKDQVLSEKKDWTFFKKGKFDNLIISSDLSFIIQLDSTITNFDKNIEYGFTFETVNSLVNYYSKAIEFNVPDKNAQVIQLSLKTTSPSKGIALLDELVKVYSTQNLERKNHIASISLDYIEKQLGEISDSLSNTEDNLQNFRSSYQLLDVTDQVKSISDQYVTLQNQRAELVARKRYYDYVAERIEKNDDFTNMTVPASIGISDPLLNDLMSNLIAAQAQRSNLIANNQEKNPLVKKLEIQIENLRRTIIDNISSVRQTTDISLSDINRRVAQASDKITSMPGTQRRLGGIERKYQLNNAIYNYLLEKRAEAQITQASNLPDNIILEPAKQQGIEPVSPNEKRIFLIAFALGLGFPFGLLMIKSALNDKIESNESIENFTEVPVLGKILHNQYKKTSNVVFEYPKSTIAESYRSLRTNLDYNLIKGAHKGVLIVTSCIQGEGKSFNAINLAMSYAQLGRKTIIIDMDMRKASNYFNDEKAMINGLSSYLSGETSLNDIIIKTSHEKLDYIPSGPIPSNPAELLAHDDTENLIETLKSRYDYLIIDTPPLAQVTDAYLLMKNSDIKIIVVRYNYSKKSVLKIVLKSMLQKNVQNVCIVMNDNKIYNDQYGYGYGYAKKKKWYSLSRT